MIQKKPKHNKQIILVKKMIRKKVLNKKLLLKSNAYIAIYK